MPTSLRRDIVELDQAPAFPRLDASFVHAMNRLLDRRRDALTLTLRSGSMQLRWEPQPTASAQAAYRFRLGAHAGWLALDASGQSALLGERHAERLPRELRYVLLAEALQPAVEMLERRSRMRFEWAPDDEEAARHALAVTAHCAGFRLRDVGNGLDASGHLHFDQPGVFDTHVPTQPPTGSAPPAPQLDRLRFALNFCLGRTQIRLREVREIRPGDIVSLETWDPLGGALRVIARVGGANGRRLLALAEGHRITLQPMKGSAMNRDPITSADEDVFDDNTSPTLDRLDALEVTLRFEVGDLSVSLGELKALKPGHVFELPQPLNRSTVRILAHGNVLGKGHLVAVGDRLGVRVAEFAATEL
jgi:type III secretion protein Q